MSPNFSLGRILTFVVCVVIYFFLGGFSAELFEPTPTVGRRAGNRGVNLMLLFLAGAVCISFIDHEIGLVDRQNIRLAYIILGVLTMGAAIVWLSVAKASVSID